jgi:GH35 family endo-1,4-beta-xylanase
MSSLIYKSTIAGILVIAIPWILILNSQLDVANEYIEVAERFARVQAEHYTKSVEVLDNQVRVINEIHDNSRKELNNASRTEWSARRDIVYNGLQSILSSTGESINPSAIDCHSESSGYTETVGCNKLE